MTSPYLFTQRLLSVALAVTLTACGAPESASSLNGTKWSTDCGANGVEILEITFSETQAFFASTVYQKAGCTGEKLFTSKYTYDFTIGDTVGDVNALESVKQIDLTFKGWEVTPQGTTGAALLNATGSGFCGKSDWANGTAVSMVALSNATSSNCHGSSVSGTGSSTFNSHGIDYDFDGISLRTSADDSSTVRLADGRKIYTIIKVETRNDSQAGLYLGERTRSYSDGFTTDRRPMTAGNLLVKKRAT